MPQWDKYRTGGSGGTPPSASGSRWDKYRTVEPVETDTTATPIEEPQPAESEGLSAGQIAGGVAVGGGLLAGLAALAKAPGRLGALARGINAARQQAMLSGFALPKSILGNVGAGVEAAVEGKGLAPLKQILSGQTLKDAARSYASHGSAGPTPGVNLPGPMPGRIMGAMDDAVQGALQRGGYSGDEAKNALLQTPLNGTLGDIMESPMASYLHPFRRTPFNQFFEGLRKYKNASEGDTAARRGLAAYSTVGVAHGAATADDDLPLSIPLAVAASARYGLPYGAAALIGRGLADGKGGGGIAGSMLPVSEYGYEQSLSDPLKPFRKPAALTAIERLFGGS